MVTHPPPPANSVCGGLMEWQEGKFYKAYVEHVRTTGDPCALFIAERVVLATGEHLRVLGRKLGQGGFGSVVEVSVPRVGVTVAMKTFRAVSYL